MAQKIRNDSGTAFARPGDTTAYASGDLVANSTTAGDVRAVPVTISRWKKGGQVKNLRVKLKKSGTTVTNAAFRAHLFKSSGPTSTGPTVAGGDNAAFAPSVARYIGYADITAMTAGSDGALGVSAITDAAVHLGDDNRVFVLLEARGAYTPGNAETFEITIESEEVR